MEKKEVLQQLREEQVTKAGRLMIALLSSHEAECVDKLVVAPEEEYRQLQGVVQLIRKLKKEILSVREAKYTGFDGGLQ